MTRRPRPLTRTPQQPTPLTHDQVYALVVESTAERPLTTTEITQMCQARYPDDLGVTTYRVGQLLRFLARRERVVTWPGTDTDALEQRGVTEPVTRQRYWAAS